VTAWGRRGRVHTWSTSLAPLRYDRTYSQPQPAAGPCCIALRAAQWNTVRVVYMLRCPEDLLLGHAPQSQGHCVVVVSEGAGVVPLPPPAHRQTTDQPTVAVCDVRLLTLLPYTAVLCCTVLCCAPTLPRAIPLHHTTPHCTKSCLSGSPCACRVRPSGHPPIQPISRPGIAGRQASLPKALSCPVAPACSYLTLPAYCTCCATPSPYTARSYLPAALCQLS
jgi:hypothetical protein